MEFDPERRELIEAVLAPLDHRDELRPVLETTAAWAEAGHDAASLERARKATARMRVMAASFRKKTFWITWGMAVVALLVLWFSFLNPAAIEELRTVQLVAQTQYDLYGGGASWERAPFLLPLHGPMPLFAQDTWNQVYAAQRERMGGKGSILSPVFRRMDVHPDEPDNPEGWAKAAEENPEDPALFLRAANVTIPGKIAPDFPPDVLSKGEKLDPGNGIFRLMAATKLAEGAGHRDSHRQWVIDDPAKLEQAYVEFEKAADYPRWDDYRRTLYEREIAGWPRPRDCVDQIFSTVVFRRSLFNAWNLYPNPIALSLDAAAADPDPAVLDAAEQRFITLCRKWGSVETDYAGRLYQWILLTRGLDVIVKTEHLRGHHTKAHSYQDLKNELSSVYSWRASEETERLSFLAQSHMDMMPWVGDVSPDPGRLAEYAMWERTTFHFTAFALGLIALLALFAPHFTGDRTQALAVRLAGLVSTKDLVAIALLSILPAAAIYFGSTRLLPAREKWIGQWQFLLMLSQVLGMSAAIILITAYSVRTRLIRHGTSLGFTAGHGRADRVVAVICLLLIPATCMVGKIPTFGRADDPDLGLTAQIVMAIPALWAIYRIISWFACSPEKRVLKAALLRACAPILCTAAAMATMAIFALHAWESKLVAETRTGSIFSPEITYTAPEQVKKAEEIRQFLLHLAPP